jgi:hypothetical protein
MGIAECSQNGIHAGLLTLNLRLEPCQYLIVYAKCDLRLARWNRQSLVRYRVNPIMRRSRWSVVCKPNLRIGQRTKLPPVSAFFDRLYGSVATMLFVHDLLPSGLK